MTARAQPGTRRLKHIRMPEPMEARIKEIAKREDRTFNATVLRLLAAGLEVQK